MNKSVRENCIPKSITVSLEKKSPKSRFFGGGLPEYTLNLSRYIHEQTTLGKRHSISIVMRTVSFLSLSLSLSFFSLRSDVPPSSTTGKHVAQRLARN